MDYQGTADKLGFCNWSGCKPKGPECLEGGVSRTMPTEEAMCMGKGEQGGTNRGVDRRGYKSSWLHVKQVRWVQLSGWSLPLITTVCPIFSFNIFLTAYIISFSTHQVCGAAKTKSQLLARAVCARVDLVPALESRQNVWCQLLEQVGGLSCHPLRQEQCVPPKNSSWGGQVWVRGSVLAAGARLWITAHAPDIGCWWGETCLHLSQSQCANVRGTCMRIC